MDRIPEIVSITKMKHEYLDVLAMLDKQPILLTQKSAPVAVMLSPAAWNKLADERRQMLAEREDLQDTIAGLKALLEIAEGRDTVEEYDTEYKEMML